VVEVPYSDGLAQQQRYFHSAVAGAKADSAGGYAALILAPEGREVLTLEYKINYLAPARGEKLVARGEVLSTGRRLFVCRAEVFPVSAEGEETPCAVLQQTIATTARPVRAASGRRCSTGPLFTLRCLDDEFCQLRL